MPRSIKPVPVEDYNRHVCSVAQRVQAAMWTAQPGQREQLWRIWPKLAGALAALDEELDRPVIKRGMSDAPVRDPRR